METNPFNPPAGSSCPVRRLPTELLSRIFTLVNDSVHSQLSIDDSKELTGEGYASHVLPQATIPPAIRRLPCLPLSRVCRDWREVAVSTPSLWTVFAFHPGSRSPRARVLAQLTRTQDLPIDIRIHSGKFDKPKFILPTICELLLPRMYRWRSFEVRVASATHMPEILDAIFKTGAAFAPQLTSVVLACRDNMSRYEGYLDDDLSDYFVVFRRSAPRLTNISLVAVVVDWNQPWISSASNLTTLHLAFDNTGRGHPSWTTFANILHGAPQLKVFIFEVPWTDDPPWIELNTPPIKLLRLEQLAISLPARLAALLFRRCHIPALKKLTLQPNYNASAFTDISPLISSLVEPQIVPRTSFESSSGREWPRLLATVEYLCIQGKFLCVAGGANALYSNLPQLTTLVLSGSENSFIYGLWRGEDLLPQLKTLVITNFKMPAVDARLIHMIALHRQEIGLPLKEVVLRGIDAGNVPDEHLQWFQKNLERFDRFV